MEIEFSSLPLLFSLFVFVFMVWLIMKRSSTKKLPPGPWKLPIIGNIHNLIGSLPHHKFHALAKKYGPIMHLKLGENDTIVVSSPEIAQEIMKTHDIIFASRPFSLAVDTVSYNSKDLAFAPYGELWRQLRKICTLEVLSAKRVHSFRSIREEEVLNVMRSIASGEGSTVSLSDLLFSYTYKVISRAAFGKTGKAHEEFVPHVKGIVEVAAGFSLADLFPSIKLMHNIGGMKAKMEKLHHEADKILETILNDHKLKRKASPNKISDKEGDDLVDVLLNLHEQEDLGFTFTIEYVKGVILDIFMGGSETSSTVTEWTMSEMMKNPSVMEKAQAEVRQVFYKKGYVDEADLGELNYLKLVIKEVLRLHPPLSLILPRESGEECEIHGYRIPVKSRVIVNAWAIGRDPKYWDDAESFIPERFADGKIDFKGTNFEYIPFGAGRRMCPGITFGMSNVELPLANMLYYFDWKLPYGTKAEDLDMTEAYGITSRRNTSLNLIPTLRHPLPSIV